MLDSMTELRRLNKDFKSIKIRTLCDLLPSGGYLIRIDGHLTYMYNSIIYDIWDCLNEEVDAVWMVLA
ncbi:hypothetical protein [Mammaliicoccus vitulinus]|uniref:hypothetical protein n=1 Tax=Mammaliicoccus vitulinus TaxID=71237 RepID=UPI00248B70FD|nr:hypothetical protein [Mammaliicoccus vitulinus]